MLVEQGYAPLWVLIPTFSPQGDGNEPIIYGCLNVILRELIPTFSPQGDGNLR